MTSAKRRENGLIPPTAGVKVVSADRQRYMAFIKGVSIGINKENNLTLPLGCNRVFTSYRCCCRSQVPVRSSTLTVELFNKYLYLLAIEAVDVCFPICVYL